MLPQTAAVCLPALHYGMPLSTTHVSALHGALSAQRRSTFSFSHAALPAGTRSVPQPRHGSSDAAARPLPVLAPVTQ